jgi:uncharacterized protein (DUF3820 family)
MRMPFGIHEGKDLQSIPKGYLYWLLQQDWLKSYLRKEIEEVLQPRKEKVEDLKAQLDEANRRVAFLNESLKNARAELEEAQVELMMRPDISSWWKNWKRRAVMTCHPDRNGGDDRAMKLINELAERLAEFANS